MLIARPLLATHSKTLNCEVADDVRRRIPWRITICCPPRYLGGYFLNGLLGLACLGVLPAFGQMTAPEVMTVVAQAATRAAQVSPNSVIAVVDREGFVLAVWGLGTNTSASAATIGAAVSKAGTAAFLSSNEEALTSRTAGFIVQQNFPPGVENKPPGPLVGVNFSNLPFSDVNRFKGLAGYVPGLNGGVNGTPVPNTSLAGSPGGVPLYRNGVLIGGVGVTGDGSENLQIEQTPDTDEDVALAGQTGFAPPEKILGSHILIDGIRVPYVETSTSLGTVAPLGSIGSALPGYAPAASPGPITYPALVLGGLTGEVRQPIISDPAPGLINGQARLNSGEVMGILDLAARRARTTRAGIRLPRGRAAQVFITVVNNPAADGLTPVVLGTFRTPDATMFSWDVAVQKARTVVFFSNDTRAYSTRTVGFLAQSMYPPGISGTAPGIFNGLQERFSIAPPNPNLTNGITIFPGGFPLYRNGALVGAVGVSGDGIDQDDLIAASGAANFLASDAIRGDRFGYRGARLPYAKFPRNPAL